MPDSLIFSLVSADLTEVLLVATAALLPIAGFALQFMLRR